MIFYYSGCGNSRWVARELAQRMGQELRFIPHEKQGINTYNLKEGEPLGFVFPIYAWRAPSIVRDFVGRMRVEVARHATSYVFMACTCGDSIGNADKRFRRLLARQGLRLCAAVSITMPETYVNLPGFQLDGSDQRRAKLELARTTMRSLASLLMDETEEVRVTRGKRPWLTTGVLGGLFERLLVTDRPFSANEACVACARCAEVCPVGNITLEPSAQAHGAARPVWHGACLTCMACYHYCPQNAIQWGRATRGKGQYHFPDGEQQEA